MRKQPRRIVYRRSDRRAVAVIAVLVAVAIGVGAYLGFRHATSSTSPPLSSSVASPSAPVATEGRQSGGSTLYYKVAERTTELFVFDPNTADSTALLRLGLQPWQVCAIYKYRARGGTFSRPSDFARLHGLTAGQYRRLAPYIRIAPDFRPAAESVAAKPMAANSTTAANSKASQRGGSYGKAVARAASNKIGETDRIVLNTADTTQLMRVPGIGRHFARRIAAYGRRLGGYVSTDQLNEVRDFPADAKRYFVVSDPRPQSIKVNSTPTSQLARHPYMGYARAKAIAAYRRLHGNLSSLSQLGACAEFSPDDISRLAPYVEF